MNRREFIERSSKAGIASVALTQIPFSKCSFLEFMGEQSAFAGVPNISWVEARYYKKHAHKEVECLICPRECKVGDRERGYCGTRENRDGVYRTLVYGKPCALNIDPIEKKPFFHFLPGTTALSFATAGCNVNCKFCQNWDISQSRPEQTTNMDVSPKEMAKIAVEKNCPSIASTYSEPVIFYEYVYDTAVESRKLGIKNIMITGGYIKTEPLLELCKVLDAVKVDLKGFSEKYYEEIVHGKLAPILDGLKVLKKTGIWFEIVVLIVPGLNDSEDEFKKMCNWIFSELGADVPVHFSRFYPMYLLKNLPPTPVSTLERARDIAIDSGIKYVYIGNVPRHHGENTYCPKCRKMLIHRMGYTILSNEIVGGKCKFCNEKIAGIWTPLLTSKKLRE